MKVFSPSEYSYLSLSSNCLFHLDETFSKTSCKDVNLFLVSDYTKTMKFPFVLRSFSLIDNYFKK